MASSIRAVCHPLTPTRTRRSAGWLSAIDSKAEIRRPVFLRGSSVAIDSTYSARSSPQRERAASSSLDPAGHERNASQSESGMVAGVAHKREVLNGKDEGRSRAKRGG